MNSTEQIGNFENISLSELFRNVSLLISKYKKTKIDQVDFVLYHMLCFKTILSFLIDN